jgi:hypothetical protein
MKFAEITTLKDLLAYAKAEYADAQRYCNKTATLAIYSQAVAYIDGMISSGVSMDSTTEAGYVSTGKSMIESARTQWYNDGCAAPGSSSSSSSSSGGSTTPEAPTDDTSSGPTAAGMFGSWGTWLLLGAAVFGAWYLMSKPKAKALPAHKTSKRRTTRTHATRRRR